jgi:hypothetical protein
MESFFNIAWLILAVASMGCWLWHHPARSGGTLSRRHWERELVALVYALALLFPVISLTDDLHAELAIVEDSASRRVKACGQHHPAAGRPHSMVLAGTTIAGVPPLQKRPGCVEAAIHPGHACFQPQIPSGRSPPAWS